MAPVYDCFQCEDGNININIQFIQHIQTTREYKNEQPIYRHLQMEAICKIYEAEITGRCVINVF